MTSIANGQLTTMLRTAPTRILRTALAFLILGSAVAVTTVATASPAAADTTTYVKCWSEGYNDKRCETGAHIKKIDVHDNTSNTKCFNGPGGNFGTTAGVEKGSKIWVDRGCRATFKITHAGNNTSSQSLSRPSATTGMKCMQEQSTDTSTVTRRFGYVETITQDLVLMVCARDGKIVQITPLTNSCESSNHWTRTSIFGTPWGEGAVNGAAYITCSAYIFGSDNDVTMTARIGYRVEGDNDIIFS